MKRLLSLLLCLCLTIAVLTALALPCFASDRDSSLSGNPLVVDNAGLLTQGERQELEQKARSISTAHGCEVVILTVNGTGGKSARDYAEDYYVDRGYGFGRDRNGILLILDMGGREYYEITCGSAISAFPDNTLLFLESRFLPDLSDGEYADAFDTYLDYSEKILGVADGSLPQNEADAINAEYSAFMNGEEPENREPNYVKKGIWSVILGALGGLIPASAQKSSLKTVRKRRDAAGYAKEGSLNLFVNRDIYLYSNVTSHLIQRTQSTGGGSHSIGTGHSTTHTHSSGTSFGGHGGKF